MLTDYVLSEFQAHGLGELWFQQDGATSHTAHETMDLLRNHFGEHLISRFATDRAISHLWTIFPGDM